MTTPSDATPAGFLPEWHPQWGVLIAWPHAGTDWAPLLERVEPAYTALARAVLARERLLVICRDGHHEVRVRECLKATGAAVEKARFMHLAYDDTWTRDYGPLAVATGRGPELVDFVFNGWGGKHDAARDNEISRQLPWRVPLRTCPLVLEGGSVETDGAGTLLTTQQCLAHPGRNPHLDDAALDAQLREWLGVRDIIRLHNGELAGDDTDAHVDTLARFCGPETVAYVQCTDPADPHEPTLRAMEAELEGHARARGWTLVPLPLPPALHSAEGERLPATYANFLILNDAVLLPVYGVDTDETARARLQQAFPDRDVETVHCTPLLEQHGSLHCATLQLPEGVL
jgi:agmatine/peptidylarginine deiminase